ncbi:P-selectin-like [Strongylocentrotus purpuratus]|uniref:Sushi domain-containing protein n=1 Tax=Strongylocentrotus purpuratus TaxID=7668 RepID=A0A7M7NCV3_STRPU|nr:P-selectin-like [Strongylocentrotus purpuratus]
MSIWLLNAKSLRLQSTGGYYMVQDGRLEISLQPVQRFHSNVKMIIAWWDLGKWSDDPPVCRAAECEEPVAPEHGRLLDGSRQQARDIFPAGATVSFECEDDYRLVGSRRITCETDGQWSGDPPVCTVSRCPVLNIPDHVVTESIYFSDGRNIGDERIFNCVEGYVLRGDTNNLRCLESGVWSDPLPTCEV